MTVVAVAADDGGESGWTEHRTAEGRRFYYHSVTKERVWRKPAQYATGAGADGRSCGKKGKATAPPTSPGSPPTAPSMVVPAGLPPRTFFDERLSGTPRASKLALYAYYSTGDAATRPTKGAEEDSGREGSDSGDTGANSRNGFVLDDDGYWVRTAHMRRIPDAAHRSHAAHPSPRMRRTALTQHTHHLACGTPLAAPKMIHRQSSGDERSRAHPAPPPRPPCVLVSPHPHLPVWACGGVLCVYPCGHVVWWAQSRVDDLETEYQSVELGAPAYKHRFVIRDEPSASLTADSASLRDAVAALTLPAAPPATSRRRRSTTAEAPASLHPSTAPSPAASASEPLAASASAAASGAARTAPTAAAAAASPSPSGYGPASGYGPRGEIAGEIAGGGAATADAPSEAPRGLSWREKARRRAAASGRESGKEPASTAAAAAGAPTPPSTPPVAADVPRSRLTTPRAPSAPAAPAASTASAASAASATSAAAVPIASPAAPSAASAATAAGTLEGTLAAFTPRGGTSRDGTRTPRDSTPRDGTPRDGTPRDGTPRASARGRARCAHPRPPVRVSHGATRSPTAQPAAQAARDAAPSAPAVNTDEASDEWL